MIKEILGEIEDKMKKTVETFRKDLAGMRTGRANPAILDKITVPYYGVPTPIHQMATIAVPEPRLLVIQPWDKTQLSTIERALMKSDLGIMPSNDGNVIRLAIPQLTQERRQEIIRAMRKKAEEERVSIRNYRREAKDGIERLEDKGDVPEDDARRGLDDLQKITDKQIKDIDAALEAREVEISEV